MFFLSLDKACICSRGHAVSLSRTWFRLFHTTQLVKANNATSISSLRARLKMSFTHLPAISESQCHWGSAFHITCTSTQKKIACEQFSSPVLHVLYQPSGVIRLRHKFAFTGNASLQARQTKFLIFLGTSKLQIFFQKLESYSSLWGCVEFSKRNL